MAVLVCCGRYVCVCVCGGGGGCFFSMDLLRVLLEAPEFSTHFVLVEGTKECSTYTTLTDIRNAL